jgi:hypothetical protein
MTGLMSELNKESKNRSSGGARSKGSLGGDDLPTLLRQLAQCHGVLRGSNSGVPVLGDEERLLVTAVTEGEMNDVQRLLAVPGRASLQLADGDTLLHLACRHPVDRVIAAIARLRPDMNATNRVGRTPLHELARHGGSLAILGSLVKLGADPWARDHMGRLPQDDIAQEQLRQGFEKWLASHDYAPPQAAKKPVSTPLPLFTKSGKRCVAEVSSESTVQSVLEELPADLAALRPVRAHLALVEYRRKVGDAGPKLTILLPAQRLLELVGTWGEDPNNANAMHRLLLVPAKAAPRDAIEAYEKAGFGQIGYKK